jgi:hypothetical protein
VLTAKDALWQITNSKLEIANEANFTAQNRKNHLKMKAESVKIKIATEIKDKG